MNKRMIAAVTAGVLALLGVLVLVVWAKGANDRAYDGAKLTSVVRVTGAVPAGTSVAELKASTTVTKIPQNTVPAGAVTDLAQVEGEATTVALVPGEVLLKSRLAQPGAAKDGETSVPKGLQEITLSLEPQRVVGTHLKVGDTVGVFASYTGDAVTKDVKNKVVITRLNSVDLSGAKTTGNSLITLAVSEHDAERIIHAQEFGRVWLSKQNSATDTSGSKLTKQSDVAK